MDNFLNAIKICVISFSKSTNTDFVINESSNGNHFTQWLNAFTKKPRTSLKKTVNIIFSYVTIVEQSLEYDVPFASTYFFGNLRNFLEERLFFRKLKCSVSADNVTTEMCYSNYCSFGRFKLAIFGRLKYLIFGKLQYFNFWEIEMCYFREIEVCHFREIVMYHFREIEILF